MSLLIRNQSALREKVQRFDGALADYWRFFLRRCLANPEEHPIDLALAYCATGDEKYGQLFRQEFSHFISELPGRDATNQAQFHQWTNALPAMRWALAFDWVAESGLFDDAFLTRTAYAFIGYAERQCWPIARSRVLTGDNQFFAVCLACAVFGHLFGLRYYNSATAREMADYAERRLPDAIGQLPPGGYSGEGYYHNQVVAVLASLYCAFFEAKEEAPFFETRYAPNGVSIKDILNIDYHTIMPGGLLVPWDASLFHPVHVKMNLAYLAGRSGEMRYLSPITRYHMFEGDPRPGWGRDDDAWTWLWWPEQANSFADIPAQASANWARDSVGFGLVNQHSETGLLQNFDTAHRGNSPSATRAQSDPNNIVLVGLGTPLVLDGGDAHLPEAEHGIPAERAAFFGSTGFGYHNCLVIDEQYAARVLETTNGTLRRFVSMPALSLGEADVASAYRDYRMSEVSRRSIQLADDTYLIIDRVAAPAPHRVTWQLFVRPYAKYADDRFTITTPEAVRLTIFPPKGDILPVQRVEGIPGIMENTADWLRVTQSGDNMTFCSLLTVDAATTPMLDLTEGWEIAIDQDERADHERWMLPNADWPVLGCVDLERNAAVQSDAVPAFPLPQRFIWDYMDRRFDGQAGKYDAVSFRQGVWLRRTFTVPEQIDGQFVLRISRPCWYFRLYLDGQLLAGEGIASPTGLGQTNHVPPAVIPLPIKGQAGSEHELVIAIAHPFPSTAMGAITLERAIEPPILQYDSIGEYGITFTKGATVTDILWDRPQTAPCQVGRLCTDALCASASRSHWGIVDGSELSIDGQQVLRSRNGRISASYSSGELTLSHLNEQAVCDCTIPEGRMILFGGPIPQLIALLHYPMSLRCSPATDNPNQPAIRCEQLAWWKRDGDMYRCELQHATNLAACREKYAQGDARERIDALYQALAIAEPAVTDLLLGALHDPSWVVQAAAARILGLRMEPSALAPLLALLAEERSRDTYHGILNQNAFPQWPGGSSQLPLPDHGSLPDEAFAIAETGSANAFANRWRLKQAIIEALGLLGDPRAVDAIIAVVDQHADTTGIGMGDGEFYTVRKAAAEALGLLHTPEALRVLTKLCDESEVNTRYAAQYAVDYALHGITQVEMR